MEERGQVWKQGAQQMSVACTGVLEVVLDKQGWTVIFYDNCLLDCQDMSGKRGTQGWLLGFSFNSWVDSDSAIFWEVWGRSLFIETGERMWDTQPWDFPSLKAQRRKKGQPGRGGGDAPKLYLPPLWKVFLKRWQEYASKGLKGTQCLALL